LLLSETCRFKLEPGEEQKPLLEELIKVYREMVKERLGIVLKFGITSKKRLHEAVYRRLRTEYPGYPSHYIYTAITQALAMFKSYRRLSRKWRDAKPPEVKAL